MSEVGTNYERIAELCHEVNRAYCQSIGDTSQPTWENAPQWQKDSAIVGVRFHFENETTPEQSHESWMKQKVEDGWVYGAVKDPEKKTHPCMVSYSELPVEQRTKDYLFKAVCDVFKRESKTSVEIALTVETEQATRDLRVLEDQSNRTAAALARLNAELDRLQSRTEIHIKTPEVYLDGQRWAELTDVVPERKSSL